jgi:phosphoenolpyruvate synthase/pyruvate phosphate dikinase
MPLTIPLEQIRPEHAAIVGGKAAVLAQMGRKGIAVPGGLSISTEAYRSYVAETGLALRAEDAEVLGLQKLVQDPAQLRHIRESASDRSALH